MLGRLHHVVLDCPDPAALAAFYSELLDRLRQGAQRVIALANRPEVDLLRADLRLEVGHVKDRDLMPTGPKLTPER